VRRIISQSIFFSCLLAFFTLIRTLPAQSGTRQSVTPAPHTGDLNGSPADGDEARDRLTRDMAKKANQERLAALKVDTDKLLKLSVELKSYVDKSNENVLSLDVIKRAEEIEKLAHSVKDKMKGPN
jgi:hypothetical protein